VLAWRVALALRLPGRDVGTAFRRFALAEAELEWVLELAEWCLYRGHVQEAQAGLLEAWPRLFAHEELGERAQYALLERLVLTLMDAWLMQEPVLSGSRLRELLAPLAEAGVDVAWSERVLALRSGKTSWEGTAERLVKLKKAALGDEQLNLLLSLEPELQSRHGWPRGRTQLVPAALCKLLDEAPTWQSQGKGRRRKARPATLLLPGEEALVQWVRQLREASFLHPHIQAATALALGPWGQYLHRLGLVDEAELTAWEARLASALAPLADLLESLAPDPLLASEIRQQLQRS
jgi:hypothetical protein